MRSLLFLFLFGLAALVAYAAMPVIVGLVDSTVVATAVAMTLLGLVSVPLARMAVRSAGLVDFRRAVRGGFLNGFVWIPLAVAVVLTTSCLVATFQYQSAAAIIALSFGGLVTLLNYVIIAATVGSHLDQKPEC